jgi:hypothetical protein
LRHPKGYLLTVNVAKAVASPEPFVVWVNLPKPQNKLKLEAQGNTSLVPTVGASNGLRTALTFANPPVGEHSWVLQFE